MFEAVQKDGETSEVIVNQFIAAVKDIPEVMSCQYLLSCLLIPSANDMIVEYLISVNNFLYKFTMNT